MAAPSRLEQLRSELQRAAQRVGCQLTPLPSLAPAALRVRAAPAHGPMIAEEEEEPHARGGSDDSEVLLVSVTSSSEDDDAHWPDGSELALSHPGLRGCARRARGLGARLVVDTSLGRPGPLRGVGGYYSPGDACVALAPDSSWGELVHEMTHMAFDQRVKRSSAREFGHGGGADGQDAAPPFGNEPLLTHWRALRARGYSADAAEELLVREHEMRMLVSAPAWRRVTRSWVLWDSALVEASRDLQSVASAERSPNHAAELLRVTRLRTLVTGPFARLAYLGTAAGVAVCVATGLARYGTYAGAAGGLSVRG